jgi:hypothetical protein
MKNHGWTKGEPDFDRNFGDIEDDDYRYDDDYDIDDDSVFLEKDGALR